MHIGDFSIRTRLLSGFGLIAALMLAAAAAGSWGLHSIVETTRKAIEGDFRVARLAAEIKMGVGQLRRFEKDVFINIESSEKVASYSQKWQLAMEQTEHARSTAYKLAQDDARGAVDALGGELRAYAEGFRTTLTLISGGTVTTTAQANDVMGKYKTAVYRTEELVDQVHKDANHRAGKVDEVIRERRDSVRVILITLAALSLLIAVSLAIVITRGIAQPLQYAVRIAQRVAAGELGHHIAARGDEIGQLLQALREMDCQLAETIGEVREGAQTVRATASELADSNDHMSQRTQEQASSLEETAASIEEMTASVQANAENAGHASRLARGAREVATAGGETVTKAAEAMEAISNSSRRIADIISVIDEIAFQTNLLALNAAVEAARAGEQGRGFAVVAGEVRNLAQRSAAAAKEIKALIGDSVEKVHAGSKLVEKSGEHLRMIVESIHKVTDVVAEIASASSQQAAGVTQLNDAVSQLDAMTQQNAAATEQISAASKQMFEQSERLAKKTAYFRVRSPGETPAAALSLGRATAAVPGHHPTRADSDPDLELRYGT